MALPTVLYGVGATKAGTSWLYRYLHDHPDCKMPAVKEAHYWDTFDATRLEAQTAAFRQRLRSLRQEKQQATEAGRRWQADNLDRRINQMKGLITVLQSDRSGHQAYLKWLMPEPDHRLVGDITPGYATLPDDMITQMRDAAPSAKFIYQIRDPLDRLWSHIRMQARRQRQPHEVYEKKANNILYRILNRDQERHILERGDYPKVIRKLRRIVPQDRLLILFSEDLFEPQGRIAVCDFLGIEPEVSTAPKPVHKGADVIMLDKLRPRALGMLSEHYDWVARNVGPLPQRWQDNLARS